MQRQFSVNFHPAEEEVEPPSRAQYLRREFPLAFAVPSNPLPAIRRILSEHSARDLEDQAVPSSPLYTAAAAAFAATPQNLVRRLQVAASGERPATQEWSDEEDDDDEDMDTVFFPNHVVDQTFNVPCRLCSRSQTIEFDPLPEHEGYYVAVLRPCVCMSF
ncbi:hypothetical protein [Geminiviridae sp.]|nr:hypothetical protein [Geminiviridae sp.]